nr:glycosyltransferase family 2 protein [Enterococcus cecorum]
MNDIYAGIVCFNPNIERFNENIRSICSQVPYVIVFDNDSKNISDIKKVLNNYSNVELLTSERNVGIAAALNKLMQWGLTNGYNWMLSLDQDSVCDDDYIFKMKKYLYLDSNWGIVAPVIIDRNIGLIGHNPKNEFEVVKTCITSGSFTKIKYWSEVGRYDESMFIDSVDFEFCYRMKKFGHEVVQIRDICLLHEIGKSIKKRFFFWSINVSGHSSFRKYYIARNNVYYPKKHGLWFHFLRGNYRNLKMILIVLLYENEKSEKINSILSGWRDAIKQKNK